MYNRTLHPDDLTSGPLVPYVERLAAFEKRLSSLGIAYRKDHGYRAWEYATLLQLLEDRAVPKDAAILDTGSGASYLPLYLVAEAGYTNVTVTDSMAYGDIEPMLVEQCLGLGILVPMRRVSVEGLIEEFGPATFDVSICVSTIEHVANDLYPAAMRSLIEVTKPGGIVYLTTDVFPDFQSHAASPFKQIQHTIFTPTGLTRLPDVYPVDYIGPVDFTYRGSFVHNYTFGAMAFTRRA